MAYDRCCGCGKAGAPSVCSACRGAQYCGVQCQRRCWKVHKLYCQAGDRAALWRQCLASGDRERMMEAVRNLGPDFKTSPMGASPLHDIAVATAAMPQQEGYALLSEIFELQPSLNVQDAEGNTPLHLACRACNIPFIDMALGQALVNLDLSIQNAAGHTAEDCLAAAANQLHHSDAAQKFAMLRPGCIAYQEYRHAKEGRPLPLLQCGIEKATSAHGDGFLATIDLPPGTLVLRETAFAMGSSAAIVAAIEAADADRQKVAVLWPRDGGHPERVVAANAYSMPTAAGPTLGLFPLCSFFNHSCDPNIFLDFVGTVVFARTCRAVRAGEELFVSYVPESSYSLSLRRQALERYDFACTCHRCASEEARPTRNPEATVEILDQAIAAKSIGRFEASLGQEEVDLTPDVLQSLERYCAARMEESDMEEVLKGTRVLCKLLSPYSHCSRLALPSMLRLSSAFLMLQDEAGYIDAMAQATALCRTCLGGGQNMLFDRFPLDWGSPAT
eukprot:GGOE01044122.1.p2 GENE.GGOE01044122.1~~GGOE01044122.1.p2  ORF type:complete len:510 (+),score=159.20 GGOE01044122.1:22-1530(+)